MVTWAQSDLRVGLSCFFLYNNMDFTKTKSAREVRQEMPENEYQLRRMLAVSYSGSALYFDDGELQDSRVLPFIDFLRDSPSDIQNKMAMRTLDQLKAISST